MSRLASRSAIVLCVLTALFGIRVVGQALVAFLDVAWLPAMDTWDSGLLPYAVRCCRSRSQPCSFRR